jgi:hypothetical protein
MNQQTSEHSTFGKQKNIEGQAVVRNIDSK